MLSTWLPSTIISKLYAFIPPNNGSDIDRRVWSGFSNGCFSIASTYMLLCGFNDDSWDTTWMRAWREFELLFGWFGMIVKCISDSLGVDIALMLLKMSFMCCMIAL